MKRLAATFFLPLACVQAQQAGFQIEANVVYGMYSGTALLMDVYRPANPNGYGVIYISGSGWHAPQTYDAQPLKQSGQAKLYAERLAGAGYTTFSISHRASPRFRYPAHVEDAQRAVRFVRHEAARFGIRENPIAAVGGSSGGHLVLMLGLLDDKGDPGAEDAVERQSSKVQCVVARAAPSDLAAMVRAQGGSSVVSFLGMRPGGERDAGSVENKLYREASPYFHVSPDDPPVLLMHGDADATVPFDQSEKLLSALKQAGVICDLLRVPGGGHGATFAGAKNQPDYMGRMLSWLDRHLKAEGR
jgi:acetyl esterase/lipase